VRSLYGSWEEYRWPRFSTRRARTSPAGDREAAAQLVRDAHQVCPYSNATRGNIDVSLLLAGEPI
jgi:organic hydroperoxide reductase OsmC/OhrA